ncbi:MAG: DUF433 domain-containing protein [Fulvimarina manganoxydans]|uniref:DUF433 domain-containing protein n=1 Tax=Fulvimarina manganoxydans TaxID=937218 RepID=UPI002353404B|nr:DUF433 domain-containing protein [Fulvimarina manganoxydans]MCK5934572.1 DUF433 domain-containing protein [Fulvimarina manganoxydans]
MKIDQVVSSDPEIVSGATVFAGTRVPVETLFIYLAAGDSLSTFLSDFPTVDRQQAVEAIGLAKTGLIDRFRSGALESAA